MPRKETAGSRIVSVRLPEALMQRLDRYRDWSAASRRGTSSRNAAVRVALSNWLDDEEQLAGLLPPEGLHPQFRATSDRISPGHDWVPIHRLRQRLQGPPERFDAVLEALRAHRHVELESAEPRPMSPQDVQESYDVHGHLSNLLR